MNAADYQAFTDTLRRTLDADPHVLGLIALGSMADLARRDDGSDHDFFVIVTPGAQESFRQQLDWLPDETQIILRFRETEHGLKIMYSSGHLLEFAVFDLDELSMAKANDYAVLLDKADVATRMAAIQRDSVPGPVDVERNLLHMLSLLQVGTSRYGRGEAISGHVFIKTYALGHLLKIIPALHPQQAVGLDNLDPYRRFERAFPALGQEINALLLQDVLTCAEGLMALAEREVQPHTPQVNRAIYATLRAHFAAVRARLRS